MMTTAAKMITLVITTTMMHPQ
jgi:hypothetical protein